MTTQVQDSPMSQVNHPTPLVILIPTFLVDFRSCLAMNFVCGGHSTHEEKKQ